MQEVKGALQRLNILKHTGAPFRGLPFYKVQKPSKSLSIHNIVILGDSVALGYGTNGGIVKHLKDTFPDTNITNLGINGLTSGGLVERLESGKWDKTLASADLVLLNIGGNDLLRSFKSGGAKEILLRFWNLKKIYRKNLLQIYQHILKYNEDVIIVQNSLYNSMRKEVQYYGLTNLLFRVWNSAIGHKRVIISKTETMGKDPAIWLDSIHPNEKGYEQMHKLLIKTLVATGFTLPTHQSDKL